MKKGLYRRLAWTGIKNNGKLYIPYILTCIGTVMMCYIISFLSTSSTFAAIRGGDTVQVFLGMGFGVMAVFSLIFLFYTNSFLIRRRKKEFGLYNILGLGKRHLAKVMILETLMIAGITISGGLFLGILLSKFSELFMIKVLGGTGSYTFIIDPVSVKNTVLLFLGIFLLVFLNTLRQIHLTNSIQLLHSEQSGEKPPKANWLAAALGVLLLGGAYYLAVTIQDPVTAIAVFFLAVVMVIVATYLLFIAGSVALCRVLQKNKRYYYKTNHFVSVSSMVYRMKRNGAGLASICILCTMVLVMISSTTCLYVGAEDSLRNRYPRNISLDVILDETEFFEGAHTEAAKDRIRTVLDRNGVEEEDVLEYRTAAFGARIQGDQINLDQEDLASTVNTEDIWQIFLVSVSDYNRLMGKNEELSPGEAIVYTTKEMTYDEDEIHIGDLETLKIAGHADGFVDNSVDSMQIFPTMYLFVPDIKEIIEPLKDLTWGSNDEPLLSLHWYYGFDLPCEDEVQMRIQDQITHQISELTSSMDESTYFRYSLEGVARERADFYGIYAGLFFLGIFLGIVFVFAAVLIIYYKQVSEGYEDQSRFDIMQKVGMTKKEIRKSINSQILTVFFLPLLMAGLHLGFAFPLIKKMLLIFGLTNTSLLIITTVSCYLVFALFYMLVYRITSGSYFTIVSGMRSEPK
ncbi:MAG TPA: ABC transporter permease [Candidatus Blautia faecigallinarum]|uniref:ABC transporter permease n=1 Tax=Candidatus Blautia faecigallinarum TaxID=2838488 RepID=A0A9D2DTI3_9FIRM|nr:ABC transporter permease [Candidatus Blautia faecigallinarum]